MTKSRPSRIRQHLGCYALLTPTFLLLGVFTLVPVVWAFSTSFYEHEIGGESRFVGFANYLEFFRDPLFWPSIGHMLFLTAFAVGVVLVFPLLIAKLIFSLSTERARYRYRVIFLAPLAFPGVALIMIWGGVMYGDAGVINNVLKLLGLGQLARGWLADPRTALGAVAFLGFPWANGINILVYYAGLSSIPESVEEAAEMDGATGLRKFFLIEIPMIFSQIKLLVILAVITGVQGFENVLILTHGGPGFETMVPGLWMYYNAFSFQRMGVACAIGVILFFVIFGATVLHLRYFKSSEELQGARA